MALLPVTLRNVEAALQIKGLAAGKVSDLQPRPMPTSLPGFKRCSAATITTCRARLPLAL